VSTHFIRRCSQCSDFSVREEEATSCISCGGALLPPEDHFHDIISQPDPESAARAKQADDIFRMWKFIGGHRHIRWLQQTGDSYCFPSAEGEPLPRDMIFELSEMGYIPLVRKRYGGRACLLIKISKRRKKQNIALHIALFLLTLVTTTLSGYMFSLDMVQKGFMKNPMEGALSFSLGLLFILGSHEFAHWFVSRKEGILASFPYFIPMVPAFSFAGTLGAMINIKTPPPDRSAMIKLGASGPLVGLVTSIAVIYFGLKLSPLVDITAIRTPYISFGEPLLFKAISMLVVKIPQGKDILLHPLAIAGWFSLLVNGINLMPVGQLDGGHIARAYLNARQHAFLSFIVVLILCLLGFVSWKGWYFLAFMCFIMTMIGNPGAIEEEKPPDLAAKIVSVLALCTMILSLTLEPIRFVEREGERKSEGTRIPVAKSIDRISSAPDRS